MIVTYSNRTYRITYQSIALVENALGNPNLIQISLTTDCEVKVAPMPEYDINYLPNGEYRSWQLTGINTKLNRKEQHFIYARLERDSKEALLVFSMNDYNVDGTTGEGTTPSEYYYYIKLGKITATDTVEGATVMREVTLDYGYLATPADRTENFFRLRTDANGNEYIITKYHVVSEQSYTSYATPQTQIPSLFEGIPFDNKTIWLNPETKVVEVIGGTGGSDLDVKQMWAALAANTTEQINKSHLTNALQEYATTDSVSTLQTEITKKWTQDDAKIKNWDTAFGWGNHAEAGYAHLANEEIFTGLKHFSVGLTVGAGKHKLYEKDGVVYFDGDLAVTGGITQYALGDTPVSTIMDGVSVDEITITKGTDNVLRIKDAGGGSSFDSAEMWKLLEASTTEQINRSHLTTALQGYATESWANSNFLGKTDKAVDSDKVDGIHANGFCRAYSASYSFGDNQNLITTAQFVEKLKSLGAFNQPYWMCKGSWYYAGNQIISDSGYGNIQLAGAVVEFMGHEGAYTIRITTAPAATNGARNSIFIYQNHGESYEPRWIKVAMTFDNVYSADKLSVYDSNNVNNPNWDEYKATIQNFGASATGIPPVGDNANSVLNIPMSKHGTNKMYGFQMAFCSQKEEIFARTWKHGNIGSWYGIPMVVSGRLKKGFNSVECTDWFRSHGNTGWYSETWGGGWYMDDADWVKVYNNKSIYTGGKLQTRGDVEITGAGVFTTSNNIILRRVGYTNTDILRWYWNETYGDHLYFTIPGTNDQSKWARLSSSRGFYVSGNIESTNGLKGVYLNLSDTYSTAISDSNKLNS